MNLSSILKQNGRVSLGNIVSISRNICGSRVDRNKHAELPEKVEYNSSVREAEKVVGYPTSFLNLRWLLNDEIANVVMHLKKLIGTEHPFLKITKSFIFKNELASWGLIVLLISKAGGLKDETLEIDRDTNAGILHSQRVVAEITDMIRSSMLIHKGLVDIKDTMENAQDMNYGNKIALLSGDYLLSKSFNDLADIRNYKVNEIISSALRDCSEAEFFGQRDKKNEPLPEKPKTNKFNNLEDTNLNFEPINVKDVLGNPRDEWIVRNVLRGANLLGKSCQATLLLADRDKDLQKDGYNFGKNFALAWQAKLDYESFVVRSRRFSLVSAPIMMHLMRDPSLYEEIKKGCYNVDDCDYEKIKKIVLGGSALSDTKDLQYELAKNALKNLNRFPNNPAKEALKNIVKAM